MANQSAAYSAMIRQIAIRRRSLIRDKDGRYVFPNASEPWVPGPREQAVCESYIVMFVAELEKYIENIVSRALSAYTTGHRLSYFSNCKAGTKFYEAVFAKSEEWKKNNNTNWSRIGSTFEFIGLTSSVFPPKMWDDIESIAHERGGIVHGNVGAQSLTDPRIIISQAERLLGRLRLFDRDAACWLSAMEAEVARLHGSRISFVPGLGTFAATV